MYTLNLISTSQLMPLGCDNQLDKSTDYIFCIIIYVYILQVTCYIYISVKTYLSTLWLNSHNKAMSLALDRALLEVDLGFLSYGLVFFHGTKIL